MDSEWKGFRVSGTQSLGMRYTSLIITFVLCLASWGAAQTLPQEGKAFESVLFDLTGDGRQEKIALIAYNVHLEEESFWGRLKVFGADGQVLWAAPAAKTTDEEFAFGFWPYGAAGLEWLGDIDDDGKVELISRFPVSDVRPPTFRRYRWNGKAFEVLNPKMILEDPTRPGTFLWREPAQWDGVQPLTWVTALSGGPEQIIADIISYRPDGGVWMGQAEMRGSVQALEIREWRQSLGPR